MIILEYLPYGDLLGYLRKSRGIEDTYNTGEKRPNSTLSEKDLFSFAWMIADGMNYLSTMKVNVTLNDLGCIILAIPIRFRNNRIVTQSVHSVIGSRMNGIIFCSFRKWNSSQRNTDTVYFEYIYSEIVPKERALR